MKKNIALIAATALLIIAFAVFAGDLMIYLAALVTAIIIMQIIRIFRPGMMKLTRWAKAWPRKAQVLITVLQIILVLLGIVCGYDLKEAGYELSGATAFVFGSILVIGFLSVRFLPQRKIIAIPFELNRDRVAYMSIALSSYVIMLFAGNRMEDRFPDSRITQSLKVIDHAIFRNYNTLDVEPDPAMLMRPDPAKAGQGMADEHTSLITLTSIAVSEDNSGLNSGNSVQDAREKRIAEKDAVKLEKKKKKAEKRLKRLRLLFAGGVSAGAILLIILLVGTLCAGVCLFIAGVSGSGAGLAILGAIVAGGSVWGIAALAKVKKNK